MKRKENDVETSDFLRGRWK